MGEINDLSLFHNAIKAANYVLVYSIMVNTIVSILSVFKLDCEYMCESVLLYTNFRVSRYMFHQWLTKLPGDLQ